MPWLFELLMQGSHAKEWISQERGCWRTWKVSDCTERGDWIAIVTMQQRTEG